MGTKRQILLFKAAVRILAASLLTKLPMTPDIAVDAAFEIERRIKEESA